MSKQWYPVIDYSTCTSCGACMAKCSHGVYAADTDNPKIVFPDGCIDGCRGCQNLCPAGSISYVGDTSAIQSCNCSCDCQS